MPTIEPEMELKKRLDSAAQIISVLCEMMHDTCLLLEMHNLIEFLPTNVYGWWQQQKQDAELDMTPVDKIILNEADRIRARK